MDFTSVVQKALAAWSPEHGWYDDVVTAAEDAYQQATGAIMPPPMASQLRHTLSKTGDPATAPAGQDERVSRWLATWVEAAAVHANAEADHDEKTWHTREDDRVRHSHEELDGVTIPLGAKFRSGDTLLDYPGQPIGSPDQWINCRCHITTGKGAMTASASHDGEIDEITQVPFHGVATVTDQPTGDRRQLASTGYAARPLPLPLFYQRAQGDGHGGSTVVGQLTSIRHDPSTGKVHYGGHFNYTPEAGEAVQGVAEGWLKGVSVDLDDVLVDYSDLDNEDADFDASSPSKMMDAMQKKVTTFKQWRVAGLTMVGVPAFHQAYISLGTEQDALDAAAMTAAAHIEPVSDVENALIASVFRDVSEAERKKSAESGHALPDGSFPIETVQDLKNAIQAIGRAKDPAKAKAHIKKRARALGHPELIPDGWALDPEVLAAETEDFAPGTHDGPGWITTPIPTERIRRYWVHGPGAAKIGWGVDGDFNRCRTHLAKYIAKPEWLAGACANMHKEATGAWPGHAPGETRSSHAAEPAAAFTLVASAAGVAERPPAAWFQNPGLTEPTPITIEGDHVFGHIATWGTCHIGMQGICTTPPYSQTNYAWFRLGAVDTDEGLVPVGQITMGTGHADLRATRGGAAEHYDNTGTAVADVAAGEDTVGIWFSGRLRPGASDDQRAALLAAKLSGDWRQVNGNLELVAALAVNTPGFGIPRTGLVASAGEQLALVAAGIVEVEPESEDERVRRLVREQFAMVDKRQKAKEKRTKDKVRRVAEVRKKMEGRA